MDVDIGILNAERQDQLADNAEEEEFTRRWDVYNSLHFSCIKGNICAADIADGSTLTPALPSTPGLTITGGLGAIPLPLSEIHFSALKENRFTHLVEHESFHGNIFAIEARRIRMKNPNWEASMEKLVKTCAYKLGVDPNYMSADLDRLLLMEKDSYIEPSKLDDGNDDGKNDLGHLWIQLPSAYSGGKIGIISCCTNETTSFNLSIDSAYSCHYLCHYKQCGFSVGKLRSGSRVFLHYHLKYSEVNVPTACSVRCSTSLLRNTMQSLRPADKMILVPFAKEYKEAELANGIGINALADHHRAYFEYIKAASGWKIFIVNAEMKHSYRENYYEEIVSSSRAETLEQVFDENGIDVTANESWLKNVIDFDLCDEDDMMLVNENFEIDGYMETWGDCVSGSGVSRVTKQYKASFILAYDDTLADVEMKCLNGSEGVDEVADIVISEKNYPLLNRLLAVVERKEKCKLEMKTCTKLLRWLSKSRSQKACSSVVNKVISGLATTLEPDVELYDAILVATRKFGHDNISASISQLLSGADQNKRGSLLSYLRRANFILRLSNCTENGSNYLEKNLSDMAESRGMIGDSTEVITTIDSMLIEHGMETMAQVVKETLAFMNRNNSISVMLDQITLIGTARDLQYDFVRRSIVEFGEGFAKALQHVGHYSSRTIMKGDRKSLFMLAIRTTVAHVATEYLDQVGRWAAGSEETFSLLLELIREEATAGFLQVIFNKCFVQSSTKHYGWSDHTTSENPNTVVPSLHVRKILKEFPTIVKVLDGDARLPLHHAVDHEKTAHQTIIDLFEAYPQAISVRDPASKLYPFMTAGSKGNLAASFDLLRADPSLVAGGIPADAEDTKKRKRSLSMDVE